MSGPEVSEYLLFCLASCLGPKQQAFGQKPTEVKMKLPNFVNPYADSSSKIGHDFNNNVVKKIKLPKNYFYKKCSSILQWKKNRKIQVVLDIESSLGKQILDMFWRPVSAIDGFKKFD